jgi:hypothetical protein
MAICLLIPANPINVIGGKPAALTNVLRKQVFATAILIAWQHNNAMPGHIPANIIPRPNSVVALATVHLIIFWAMMIFVICNAVLAFTVLVVLSVIIQNVFPVMMVIISVRMVFAIRFTMITTIAPMAMF